jgi:hypothetical protein
LKFKYCHNLKIFSQGPLKYTSAGSILMAHV